MATKNEQLELGNEMSWLDPDQEVGKKYAHQAREFRMDPNLMRQGMSKISSVLRQLRFSSLRQGQDEAVLSLMSMKDTYCVMPTGGGKSAIYIVPTLCMGWKTLIFSPLVSLMQDQAAKLRGFGLAGEAVSSAQQGSENSKVLMNWESNDLQFMLAAPERMDSSYFMDCMKKAPPDMVVVDEAHCISQWGDTFRTSYLKIGEFIEKVKPKVVLSLTATATKEVENDIRAVLGMQQARRVVYYPKRTNLKHRTIMGRSEEKLLLHLTRITGPVIVYCATRKACDTLWTNIGREVPGSALVYHGGQNSDERTYHQNSFMKDEVRVMFATNAFGLGVDKPNIRGILHWDIPGSLEALVQEQGRAGRDGLDSHCVMFWNEKSMDTAKWLIDTSYPDRYTIERVYHAIKRLANSQGVVQLTLDDVASALGINGKIVGSAIGILTAAKVFERAKDDDNPMKIKPLKEHPDPQFNSILEIVKQKGHLTATGYYTMSLAHFAQEAEVKSSTLMTKVRQLSKEGYLEYTLPFKGKTTRVIGTPDMVPFARIQERRELQLDKLDIVQEFVHVHDPNKHDYLQNYFGIKARET